MQLLQPHAILIQTVLGPITAHGVFFALGAGVAAALLMRRAVRYGWRPAEVLERSLWIFLAGLTAARLGYFMAYPGELTEFFQILRIWEGGLVSFFGMLGGALVALGFARSRTPEQRLAFLADAAAATLIAWSIGRLGNYYAADSVGVLSESWAAFYGRVPIQLFEAVGCAGLGIWLWRSTLVPVQRILWAGVGYFIVRFVVDIWRDETAIGLHLSQWVSLILLCILIPKLWQSRHG